MSFYSDPGFWCQSALKSGLVTHETEDYEYCNANLTFTFGDSMVTLKYMDDDGLCYEARASESIKVHVYEDGSTYVSPRGVGSGMTERECSDMIRSFKHKGLERFFLKGSKSGIQAKHASKLRLILGRLNASVSPQDMNLPGLYLHQLSGDWEGTWSVRVSGNWRVTFRFVAGDAEVVNYEDYHWDKIMPMFNPPHPGDIIKELCLEPLGLSVTAAADGLGVSRKTLSAILNGRAGISPEMAIRLSIAFDTSAESWLNQQSQYDLWQAEQHREELQVERLSAA